MTIHQALSLAPTLSVAKGATSFAEASRWLHCTSDGVLYWGDVLTHKEHPFQVAILPNQMRFFCNCGAFKQPCQHSLALLLLYLKQKLIFKADQNRPLWIDKYLQEKIDNRTSEQLLAAKAKRLENRQKRIATMQNGMNDLRHWLSDTTQQGFASLFDTSQGESHPLLLMATRLVDMKLGNIAKRLRAIYEQILQAPDQVEPVLASLAEIHLITTAFSKLEYLEEEMAQEVLNRAGVNFRKSDLIETNGIKDEWLVLGQTFDRNVEKAEVRETWFLGRYSQQFGVEIAYDYMNRGYDTHWIAGSIFEGEAIYYPSAFPMRLFYKDWQQPKEEVSTIKGEPSFEAFLRNYSKALSENPWIRAFPCLLEGLNIIAEKDAFYLIDKNNYIIPLECDPKLAWSLLAQNLSTPLQIFGIWSGKSFRPISSFSSSGYQSLV